MLMIFQIKTQMDSLGDKITGKGKYINDFSTPLPTAVRFGTSYFMKEGIIPGLFGRIGL